MFDTDRIEQGFEERMEIVFFDMKAMTINRVQTKGVAADGSPFKPYSTKDFPSYFFTIPATATGERGARQSAKEQIKKQIEAGDKYMSYAEYRQLSGYQTGHKDFTRSGQFTGAFGIVETGKDSEGFYTWLGFVNPQFSKEYDKHTRFEGKEIFEPSDEEIDLAAELLTEWIFNNMESND